ncbi:hypothetical protein SAMN05518671_2627 [Stenotrophomonas lactitubi]|nr:hypothetical protein SAMN04487863_1285 [Stenotrophomonas sp. yr243]SNT51233.1 hypothetical protein SAMN05518671_2627 [Stenotrophomonas lactitubi]
MVANARLAFHVQQLTLYERISPIPIRDLLTIGSHFIHAMMD